MKEEVKYDIHATIKEWMENHSENISLAKLSREQSTKILDESIDELRRIDLSDKEIFEILKIRFEEATPKKSFFEKIVPEYLPLTEILFLFIGGIVYLTIQYLELILSECTFIFLEKVNKGNVVANFRIVQLYWKIIIFILIISIVTVFYKANALFKYIKRVKVTFPKVFLAFFMLLVSMMIQQYTWLEVNRIKKDYWPLISYFMNHYKNEEIFADWFPMVIAVCYFLLYYNYKKESYLY